MEVLLRLPVRSASNKASRALLPVLEATGKAAQNKPRTTKFTPLCRPAYSPIRMSVKGFRKSYGIQKADDCAVLGNIGAGFGDLMEIRRDGAKGVRSLTTPTQALADSPPREQVEAVTESTDEAEDDRWQVKMLYDGECPLCMVEVKALRERNEKYGTIKFVDIADPNYSAEENAGVGFEQAMGYIHCIQRDGTVLTNVAAFRRFYEVLGMGWVYAITKYEPLATMADAVYNVWAKYRLPITGRPPLAVVLEERRKMKEEGPNCDLSGRCRTD